MEAIFSSRRHKTYGCCVCFGRGWASCFHRAAFIYWKISPKNDREEEEKEKERKDENERKQAPRDGPGRNCNFLFYGNYSFIASQKKKQKSETKKFTIISHSRIAVLSLCSLFLFRWKIDSLCGIPIRVLRRLAERISMMLFHVHLHRTNVSFSQNESFKIAFFLLKRNELNSFQLELLLLRIPIPIHSASTTFIFYAHQRRRRTWKKIFRSFFFSFSKTRLSRYFNALLIRQNAKLSFPP